LASFHNGWVLIGLVAVVAMALAPMAAVTIATRQ
jgi:uncharacterized membrane protein